jgi:hypothetical protein
MPYTTTKVRSDGLQSGYQSSVPLSNCLSPTTLCQAVGPTLSLIQKKTRDSVSQVKWLEQYDYYSTAAENKEYKPQSTLHACTTKSLDK